MESEDQKGTNELEDEGDSNECDSTEMRSLEPAADQRLLRGQVVGIVCAVTVSKNYWSAGASVQVRAACAQCACGS